MLDDILSPRAEETIRSFGRPAVGWFCSYTPVELIEAAGCVPVRVSGVRRSSGLGDSLMHTNICPFVKACLEAAETGRLGFIGAFVFTNGCDAQRRLHDVWKFRRPQEKAILVTVPKTCGPESVRRFAHELAALRDGLEMFTGNAIGDDALRAACGRVAALRQRLREVTDARNAKPPSMSGARAMELLLTAQRMPADAALAMLESKQSGNDLFDSPPPGPRVLLYGNMLDSPGLVRMIESHGARVVADNVCTGRRFLDVPEPNADLPPIDALAEAYLRRTPCPRMVCDPDAVDSLRQMVDEIRPDGAIVYTLKFCDTHGYDMPRVRDMLRDAGVKALFIDDDYSDGSGQFETRIQAFVEMFRE